MSISRCSLLTHMHSDGTLRVLSPEWGGSWVPVLDAAGAKEGCGSEHLWPVCLDSSSLTAVVTSKKAPHPQVMTRVNCYVAFIPALPPHRTNSTHNTLSFNMCATMLDIVGTHPQPLAPAACPVDPNAPCECSCGCFERAMHTGAATASQHPGSPACVAPCPLRGCPCCCCL